MHMDLLRCPNLPLGASARRAHLRCAAKSWQNLGRRWLQAQLVKGTVRQEAGVRIDRELIGK